MKFICFWFIALALILLNSNYGATLKAQTVAAQAQTVVKAQPQQNSANATAIPLPIHNHSNTVGIYSKVLIYVPNQTEDLSRLAQLGIDLICGAEYDKQNKTITLDISEHELLLVKASGLNYKIIIPDLLDHYHKQQTAPPNSGNNQNYKTLEPTASGCNAPQYSTPANFVYGSMGGFYTLDEMYEQLDDMKALYPNLITTKAALSKTSNEGRTLYFVKISDNPGTNETEPEVLYTAVHHAREPLSATQLIFYMWYLLENYSTNTDVKNLVDNTELFFVPCLNPDGYHYNYNNNPGGGGMWRKNRRDNGGGTFGVDLNRNYGYQWGYDNSGSSGNPISDTYRGTSAFSEPETQAIRDLCNNNEFRVALNHHTYGNYFIYPYGYAANAISPDYDAHRRQSEQVAWFNRFKCGTGKETVNYYTNGDSDDWMYGEQTTKPVIFAYTPETGTSAMGGFWPTQNDIVPLCKTDVRLNNMAALMAGNYGVLHDLSKFEIANNSGFFEMRLERLGLENNLPFTVTLTPLSNNIEIINNPTQTATLNLLETKLFSFPFSLKPTTQPGERVRYRVQLHNGLYNLVDDTTTLIYKPTVVFKDTGSIGSYLNWTGGWFVTDEAAYTGTWCMTDSPDQNYANSANSNAIFSTTFDLTNADHAALTFYAKWNLEAFYDYVQIQISTDGGTTYTPLCGRYTKPGSKNQQQGQALYDADQNFWVKEQINLDDYAGLSNLKIRFKLVSDANDVADGFYFDDISILAYPKESVLVGTTVLLEGPYNNISKQLGNTLRTKGLTPLTQPFNISPFNYAGTEGVNNISNIPADVCDWVLVELRDADDAYNVVAQQAGWLLKTGKVRGLNHPDGLLFNNINYGESYYIVVRSRNHLPVISAQPVSTTNPTPYDFTNNVNKAMGVNQLKNMGDGKYAMFAGDINADGVITVTDFNIYVLQASFINQYARADCNYDSNVTVADFNLYKPNSSKIAAGPVMY